MQPTLWRPFRDIEDIFGRLTKTGMPGLLHDDNNGVNLWTPSADISETKSEYLIKAELPDVKKSDIHVSVADGALKIEGERKHRKEEKDETYHRLESFYGNFSRAFSLPSDVDASKIKAECDKGVLRVHIPKVKHSEPEKPTDIKVN